MTPSGMMSTKLRRAGILVIAGLIVEALSLVWNHPLSFVAFLGIGGLLLAAGIVLYLWVIVSTAGVPSTNAVKGTHGG